MEQQQFLTVVDRDEAERRFQTRLRLDPLPAESVPLDQALDRVLARDIVAAQDVPAFDRSNFDGFAVRSGDCRDADEERPAVLRLLEPHIETGIRPRCEVAAGSAAVIATGGMLPRGADAVLMVEHAEVVEGVVHARKIVPPGFGITHAGTDVARGETVLRRGTPLTSRETGVLAALGRQTVEVFGRPRVAILSTGNEIVAPGDPLPLASVYDSNARIVADAVRELGGIPVPLGIVPDDEAQLSAAVRRALRACDALVLSGGTSKGAGDVSYRVIQAEAEVVVHGVALKPGKPVCLAVADGKPVVILPGFPTSAIFTFHEFVAPVLRRLGGRPPRSRQGTVTAEMATKVQSQAGRTEYLLVGLVAKNDPSATPPWAAFPMGKGSGAVTTFSQADGFITIDRHAEIVEAGSAVRVQLLARDLDPADLVVVGSHCVGLDWLLGRLQDAGWRTKYIAVGSTAGLQAARRGLCDVAGVHLYDPGSGQYNRPFADERLEWIPGYRRMQGLVFRQDDTRFQGKSAPEMLAAIQNDPACLLVNRNHGSGTRLLVDRVLEGRRPPGYGFQPRSHHAVVAAIAQHRADWGVAIEPVAVALGLGFAPLEEEHFDFLVPRARLERPAVVAFRKLLADPDVRAGLRVLNLSVPVNE